MAKFYQHFTGDNLGKIVTLKYIDDVSDDDFILYFFTDGSKCNKEYVAPVDVAVGVEEPEKLVNQYACVEVLSPAQSWKISKKKVMFEEPEPVIGQDGNWYEPAKANIDKNGNEWAKEGTVRIEVYPPKLPRVWEVEPEDDYLLSLHPELEFKDSSNKLSVKSKIKPQHKPKFKTTSEPVVKEVDENVDFDLDIENDIPEMPEVPQITSEQLSLPNSFTLNFDTFPKTDTMMLIIDGIEIEISKEELKEKLIAEPSQSVMRANEEIIKNENILIKSMIDMSKKKTCRINMNVKLELPPKEVYKTISNSYNEGFAQEFVQSLTARIPQESLLESLAAGLDGYYSKDEASKKMSDVVSEESED